jgi:hypothetical protein
VALDKISICNLALGQLPADVIADFEEQSTQAEWCARLYPVTLAYILDRHEWKHPRKRAALAAVENDRPGEWTHAYALPSDCVQELRLIATLDPSVYEAPLLVGQALAPWLVTSLSVPPIWRFLISGTTLYANLEAAVLEYIADSVGEQAFRPMFIRALVDELASRLVMPVKQDRQRQGDLIKMAEVSLDRAIADDINRDESASTYGVFTNETELARGGASPLAWSSPFARVWP